MENLNVDIKLFKHTVNFYYSQITLCSIGSKPKHHEIEKTLEVLIFTSKANLSTSIQVRH